MTETQPTFITPGELALQEGVAYHRLQRRVTKAINEPGSAPCEYSG